MTEFLTLIWEILVGVNDPNLNLAVIPVIAGGASASLVGAGITAGASLIGGKRQRRQARRQANQQLAFQREQQAILEEQKQAYRDIEFTNPYADMENPYAGLQNPFAGLQTDFENVYEDLTVNQQQAQFQAEQGRQQRTNILQGLRGAAGSAGIAGLAQALAGQGTLQAQQISASIGMQETQNQRLAAQGASEVQRMEAERAQQIATGAFKADVLVRQGAGATDLQVRTGEAMLQEAEMSRQATLLGMQYGQTAGANSAYQQALLNQQQANASANQMFTQGLTGLGTAWAENA